jgi:hypothetical protein
MAGFWAIQIRMVSAAELGHRYICRAGNEHDASEIASRLMGSTQLAIGFDLYWIAPRLLHERSFPMPAIGGFSAVWDIEEWGRLLADSHASEIATPERSSGQE